MIERVCYVSYSKVYAASVIYAVLDTVPPLVLNLPVT
jgi:hypothetical protein